MNRARRTDLEFNFFYLILLSRRVKRKKEILGLTLCVENLIKPVLGKLSYINTNIYLGKLSYINTNIYFGKLSYINTNIYFGWIN